MATTENDTTAPTIASFSPKDEASNVPLSKNIVIEFSEAIVRGTGNVVLKTAAGQIVATYDAAKSSNLEIINRTLTINPTDPLQSGTAYFIEIDSGAFKDRADNLFAGLAGDVYNFSTVPSDNDTSAPTVTGFDPVDGAVGVAVAANLEISFNEAIKRGTGNFLLKTGDGTVVETFDAQSSTRLAFSGNTLTIDPTAVLELSTVYVIEVARGAVTDLAGNVYAGTSSYNFTTANEGGGEADKTAPTLQSVTPADGSGSVALDGTIVLNFNEAIQLSGGNIELRTAAGALVEQFNLFTGVLWGNISVAGQTVTLNPLNDLVEGTDYQLVVPASAIKDLAGNAYAGLSDYNFSTADIGDMVAPTLTASNPANAATGIAIDRSIVLTFSEAVQRGAGTIVLKTAGGETVAQYDVATSDRLTIAGNVLTIDPVSNLTNLTAYSLEIASGAITDLAGNAYVPSAYQFTTVGTTLVPTTGNDRLLTQTGNETIDALAGTDTVVFGGAKADYSIVTGSLTVTDTKGSGGTDTLISVERLEFSDRNIAFDLQWGQAGGKTLEFIGVLAPQLLSDPNSFGVILPYFDEGQTLASLSEIAINAGLVRLLAGSDSNADLARLLYRNIYDTEPTAAALDFMVLLMGRYTQAEFIATVAGWDMNHANIESTINLVGLQQSGAEYFPTV